jgi:hypothetical protein
MTVSTTLNRISYTGNGSTTVFAFPYKFIAVSDIKVYLAGALQSSGYSVGSPSDTGANITFSAAPAASAAIVILSDPAKTQDTSLPSTGPFPAKTVETMSDKLTLLVQRLSDRISRTIGMSDSDTSGAGVTLPDLTARAGKMIGYDASGSLALITASTGTSLVNLAASSGAALIGYIAAGTGAIIRTVLDKLLDRETVFDYMTQAQITDVKAGLCTLDVSDAIQAYFDSITARRVTASSSIGYGSADPARFPKGRYLVTKALTPPAYCDVVGNRAILVASTNLFDIFVGIGYSQRFIGIGFVGGRWACRIATGGTDTTTIDFDYCEWYEQASGAVTTDTNSSSTIVNLTRYKVHNIQSGAIVFRMLTGDKINVHGGWATVAATFLQIGGASTRASGSLSSAICTPYGGFTVWVKNYGSVDVSGNNRFGGEAAATIVDNLAGIDSSDLTSVVISGNQTYCAGAYAVRFYQIPNVFVFENNRGLTDTLGFLFDAGITNLVGMRSYLCTWKVQGNSRDEIDLRGNTEAIARVTTLKADSTIGTQSLSVTDKISQFRSNSATGGSNANVTITNTTGYFGEPTRTYTGTSAAYDGSVSEEWSNQLTGQPSGVYTAVYNVEVTSPHPVTGYFFGAELDTAVTLKKGKHVVNVPFYWNSSTSTNKMGWSFSSLNNSQTVVLGNGRLFAGTVQISTWNNVLYGAAAPTALQWEVGDRTIRVPQAVGQPKAWSCTTAGTPGAHPSEGNL